LNEKLFNFLMKLPKRNLINLMSYSLDLMQHYNGRTKTYCIATALGCKQVDEHIYSLPTLKEAKERTEDCWPF